MENRTMTILRRDYRSTYEYRQAVKYWRDCGRTVRRIPGGVEVTGDSFRASKEAE